MRGMERDSIRAVRPGSSAERVRQIETNAIAEEQRKEAEQKKLRLETRRFWIQTVIAAVAALASILGVILQLL